MTAKPCRICSNADGNVSFTALEMMFGTREEFEYVECSACGTVQLADVPADLSRFYPPDYLSLGAADDIDVAATAARRIAARFAGKTLRTGRGMIGRAVLAAKPWVGDHYPEWLRRLRLDGDARILEVGCGTGRLLQTMHYFGFTNLTGIDAFIDADIAYSTGVRILKSDISGIADEYDLIMLHHSFEHLPDPKAALVALRNAVSPNGTVLVRMPVVSDASETYGRDWVQLDPPRHLFLWTERGFRQLTEAIGFTVEDVLYDSTAMQFWGSEQYRMDVPLNDPRSHNYPNRGEIFSDEQIEFWSREAERLNLSGRGDQAAYFLRPR